MTARISVALVTRNRPPSLERAVRSLRSQSEQPWEILISDDSDDVHIDVNSRIAREFECRYQRGPRRGLYANRNAVALACRGSHIRTMDDDHTFPAGHVAACAAAVEQHNDVVWIIGECPPGAEATGVQDRCPGQLHPRGYSTAPLEPQQCWAIADGATIYPRRIFEEGHRFYEGFVFGASYLEWGSRLHWLGFEIRHLPCTYVVHNFEGRSHEDPFVDAASRLFAGLSHSFIYQPTIRNRLLATAELGITAARLRGTGLRACAAGVRAFREHRVAMAAVTPAGALPRVFVEDDGG